MIEIEDVGQCQEVTINVLHWVLVESPSGPPSIEKAAEMLSMRHVTSAQRCIGVRIINKVVPHKEEVGGHRIKED